MSRRSSAESASSSVPVRRVKSPAFGLGVFGLGFLVTVGAIMLGRSDAGQIDVAAAVRQAGGQQTNPAGAATPLPPASNEFRNVPNGGLVPQGARNAAPAPEPAPTSEETATTSDDVSAENDSADEAAESEAANETETTTEETLSTDTEESSIE